MERDRGYDYLLVELLWFVLIMLAPQPSVCKVRQSNVRKSCQSAAWSITPNYSALQYEVINTKGRVSMSFLQEISHPSLPFTTTTASHELLPFQAF